MIGNRILYLTALAFTFVFHVFYFGWYSWFLLVLMVCLPVFSVLVSLRAMRHTALVVTIPAECVIGSQSWVSVGASCDAGFAPLCRVQLEMTSAQTGKTGVTRGCVSAGRTKRLRVDTEHCGLLRCSTAKSRVYDLLGLIGLRMPGAVSGEILIVPAPVVPDILPDPAKLPGHRLRPKPGGGFAEEHELRLYREGDNLRDIHWKLSAKTDNLIVREALEHDREHLVLSFDMPGTREALDAALGRLLWTSQWLLDNDTVHEVLWIDPESMSLMRAQIDAGYDTRVMLRRMLGSRLREDMPDVKSCLGELPGQFHIAAADAGSSGQEAET